jgi:hypothetical protein
MELRERVMDERRGSGARVSRILGFFVCLVISAGAGTQNLERISNADAYSALKQALADGSVAAVAQLAVRDGYFGNAAVRIPLPPAIQRIEGALRFAGMRGQADQLVLAMNRAAEAAVPEAQALLIEALQKMTVEDAKAILTGGETSATDFFRRATQTQLTARFLPIVKGVTDGVGLAEQYNALAGQAARLGLVRDEEATVELYVTRKALDGLYLTIAEQERNIRRNPVEATSQIVRRVFGAMRW